MNCNKCGNFVPAGQNFCNACGSPVQPTAPVQPTPSNGGSNNVIKIVVLAVLGLVVLVLLVIAILPSKKSEEKTTTTATALKEVDNNTTEHKTTVKLTTNANGDTNYADGIDYSNIKSKPDDTSSNSQNIEVLGINYNAKASYPLQILMKNNNNYQASGSVYLNYYKDGKRIKSSLGSFSLVSPGSKFVVTIRPRIDEPFDSVDITYYASRRNTSYEQINIKDSDATCNVINDYSKKIECTFTHNLNTKGVYYMGIIYKKNGKEVGYDSTISISNTEKKGDKGKITFYSSNAPEDYDDYEVFFQTAYIKVEE